MTGPGDPLDDGRERAFDLSIDPTDRRLADDELNALRRVATLVAEGVEPRALFSVVAEEVARVVGVPVVHVARFEVDGSATVCASHAPHGSAFPIDLQVPLDGPSVAQLVRDTSKAARIDDFSLLPGVAADIHRRMGIRSSVGSPIVVGGQLWGAIVVSATDPQPLTEGIEARVADFTELLATAISNAQSRQALERLADEQAALRRVATLVAQAVPANEIFAAVSEEVATVFGAGAVVLRFDHDNPGIEYVGVSTMFSIPVGTRWEFQPGMASAEVFRTGRAARIDAYDFSEMTGAAGETLRRLGIVSTVTTPIVVDRRLWGAVSLAAVDASLPLDTENRLEKFSELVATAIANVEHMAELAASRRRIVAASDDARRRIERDLHDGTQQRLVALGLAARAAQAGVSADLPELRSELARIATGLKDAVTELQNISRGIHPAIVSQGGLAPALRTLGRRSPIPVALDVTIEDRFPAPVEIAAYYATSESLANAAKHSHASHIEISLASCNGQLLLSIRDDGIGGADPARGSGLVGLTDRIEALGGSLRVQSPSGRGTQITVDLPLEAEPGRSTAT